VHKFLVDVNIIYFHWAYSQFMHKCHDRYDKYFMMLHPEYKLLGWPIFCIHTRPIYNKTKPDVDASSYGFFHSRCVL